MNDKKKLISSFHNHTHFDSYEGHCNWVSPTLLHFPDDKTLSHIPKDEYPAPSFSRPVKLLAHRVGLEPTIP